jgi:hypothetical protein
MKRVEKVLEMCWDRPMRSYALPPDGQSLLVRPWHDPVVDDVGHDPRSVYVERFWLSLLGPSSTFFVRYVADHFEAAPHEFELDPLDCAAALGLGRKTARSSALSRTLGRCCAFKVARTINQRTIEVRRRLAPLSHRQIKQLPEPLRQEHVRWVAEHPEPSVLMPKARRLALTLLNMGEDTEAAQSQLQRWRFPRSIAEAAAEWAAEAWSERALAAPM